MHLSIIVLFAAISSTFALPSPSATTSSSSPAFTYNNSSFLLHGSPIQLRGGQIDPQRVPPAYWADRISKAKAMGLNTIFSYVFWNLIEPQPGQWDWSDRNDIARWYRLIEEAGMHAVLRPGGYIDGERDWGGLPAWLMDVSGMEVRTNNAPFLEKSQEYLDQLGQQLHGMGVNDGGPILMAQVENEYGSFGDNHVYTSKLAQILRGAFPGWVLYTNDGGSSAILKGEIPGILAEIDGPPQVGFEARKTYVESSSTGPNLDGEYYTTWLDTWAPNSTYEYTGPNGYQTYQQVYGDIEYILSNNASFSLYMFHGGTNFGFENGALFSKGALQPVTTSYDYGSPLDESGRTIELYEGIREIVLKYVPENETVPAVPSNLPLMKVPDIQLEPIAGLFEPWILGKPTWAAQPLTMEQLRQDYGFVLYEHCASERMQGTVQPGDMPRDRVIIYVNGQRKGAMDAIYTSYNNVTVDLQSGDKLQLLVENMGRTDFGYPQMIWPSRGINGSVTVGGSALEGWEMYSLPLKTTPGSHSGWSSWAKVNSSNSAPIFYSGTFQTDCSGEDDARCDTFISIPNGIKGQVWVNGFNLGRYWIVGPQQSLYLPAPVLAKSGKNEIVVLELEPKEGVQMIAQGLDERVWGNHPDQIVIEPWGLWTRLLRIDEETFSHTDALDDTTRARTTDITLPWRKICKASVWPLSRSSSKRPLQSELSFTHTAMHLVSMLVLASP